MAKQEQKKSGCCDDVTCNAKCSALNSGVSMNLPTYKAELPAMGEQALRLYPADAAIASAHQNPQNPGAWRHADRPWRNRPHGCQVY